MVTYQQIPETVEAMQWDGTGAGSTEIAQFLKTNNQNDSVIVYLNSNGIYQLSFQNLSVNPTDFVVFSSKSGLHVFTQDSFNASYQVS